MDDIDEQILKILKDNARISYVDIGSKVGLSEGAIRNRLQSLVNAGVIKRFTIDMANSHKVRSLIMINVDPSIPTYTVSKEVMKISGVESVYEVTGEYDIITVVGYPGIDGINQCIEGIRKISGVEATNSMIVLRTLNL